jgi:subtilisin family serine protease
MRSVLVVLAAIAATVAAGAPAAAQNFRKPPSADEASALRLAAGQATESRSIKVYVVQMAGKPGISYEGGTGGFAQTAPEAGAKYDARSSQAQMYTEHLVAQQDALLASIGAGSRKIYSYRHALNGFAARLTAGEAATLKKNKAVLNVWEDRKMRVDTNNSPQFLGLLDPKNGLRAKHKLRGKGVIIGMLDTGAVQEHPSFDDTGFAPPADWNGICQTGEAWNSSDCNNKLIGARYFISGFGQGNVVPGEFLSARDSDGHGTHTATTAGGREVMASLAGTPLAQISGMAPDAYLAIYKVCWTAPNPDDSGCTFSDSAAATDAAVADGVDLLSFSVGTAAAFNDPQDIAFLNAVDAGVFVSRSAGNEGPNPATTAAGEPWAISVAASTHSGTAFALAARVNSPASVAGDYPALEGAITRPLAETGPITSNVVAANPIDACLPIGAIGGRIALIARGGCTFDVKLTNAVNAGAGAVIVYTSPATNPKVVMGGDLSFNIPGVMIDNAPGLAILSALNGGATVNATLSASVFITEQLTGNIMAGFSSRGPFSTVPDWVKPDVTAPGVRVLAGMTPEPTSGAGDFFQYLQGTSMSTPHVSGIAALLIEAHPDWTPAQIKSALMTTGRQNVVKENGSTPADPFDFGAGHIVPNKAIDPGLTYDAALFDYLAASCGTDTPLVSPADCGTLESLGFSLDPASLNLPSIGIGELVGTRTIRRTVTNVGPAAKYQVGVKTPPDFKVLVNPKSFTLGQGQSASYEVTITNDRAPPGVWRFGQLEWKDNKGHVVRSPIAANAKLIVAPADIAGTGANGATSFEVTFGYNGSYTPGAHGLESPFLSQQSVEDDPDNTFDFLGPGETLAYLQEIPAGNVYAQWSLFDAYTDGNHDLDVYLFYCPELECTQVDVSLGATSEERVSVNFPLNDPAIDDPYALIVHGFATERRRTAQFVLFDWTDPGVGADRGNMTVSGPSTAVISQSGTVNVNWAGLATGAGAKQVGAVSHSDGSSIQGLTIVNIANDPGAGFCDVADSC